MLHKEAKQKTQDKEWNKPIQSILTAIIMMALSKNPNPTNGIAL